MSKREKKDGKKKDVQSVKKRTYMPKATPQKTKERRAKTQARRQAKKERHLAKRIERMSGGLGDGECVRTDGMTLGRYHRNLMHMLDPDRGAKWAAKKAREAARIPKEVFVPEVSAAEGE